MNVSNVKLHLNRKGAMVCIAAFLAIVLLLTIVVAISTNSDLAQIQSFMQSNYVYSATAPSSTASDAYLQYNAGVSFSLSADVKAGLNAETVMQTADAEYTDLVCWNTKQLEKYGIAISANIANDNNLKIGDTLYSKNLVDGEVYEYTIEAILPAITYARGLKDAFNTDGVIVMGYDDQYASNITHTYIIFSAIPIDTLALQCSSMPEDIVYREDEMASSFYSVLPYMIVYFLVVAVSMAVFVVFFVKNVAHNFRRQIMLGFEKKALNRAYYCAIGKAVLLAIIMTALIATTAFCCITINVTTIIPVVCVLIAELVTAALTAMILNRQLWRK